MADKIQLKIARLQEDFRISEFHNDNWRPARAVIIDKYWSGETAPAGRRFNTKLLWSDTALYVRFEATQSEPLVISDEPKLKSKTIGLWDRDVCEIFIAPDKFEPRKYFEFEIAPSGEWLDLALDYKVKERKIDWDFNSGMQSGAKLEKNRVLMAVKIPWKAFGAIPQPGDIWLGNLFRCVGEEPGRGYLAWQPTLTEVPNFHIPGRFGQFVFQK